MDHDLAISVGTTELVEEAEQVHDELHNVGLGGITVQMDVLDAPKTAGQAVSRSTVNNRGWLLKNKQANVELESKHSESSKKIIHIWFTLSLFLLSSYVFKTFSSIKVMYDCFILKAPLILQEKTLSICWYIDLSN